MQSSRGTPWLAAFGACLVLAGVARADARLDAFGGYTGLKGHNDSGFFRVELIGDRYYLVTPANNVFISKAVTTALFNDRWGGFCPPLESYPTPYGNQAKYDGSRDAWISALKSNLDRWGFNGLGCWCEPGVPELTENVACLFITMHAARNGVATVGRQFCDVFDPRFADTADQRARALARYADSPFRIGAFPDNEIGWVGPDVWGRENGPTLPDVFIALPADAPGKRYWAGEFLKNRYATIDRLNAAYGTSFDGFAGADTADTLLRVESLPNDPDHPAIFEDKKDFVEAIADRYYRVVTNAMRRHDPNHLVFSARWALWTTAFSTDFPEYQAYNERIWKKAGQYCDLIAINSYMANRRLEQQHRLYSRVFAQSNRPFMITEWATFADDTQYVAHKEWHRFQRDRGVFYFNQFARLLEFKFPDADGKVVHPCVGAQWFQYYDEPSLGRTDGERNNYGLLNVKDEPYQTALDVMATFNAQMYAAVVDHGPLRLLEPPVPKSPKNDVSAAGLVEVGRVIRIGASPRFQWDQPPGAKSGTLLVSPEKSFPLGQTIRIDGVAGARAGLDAPLASGLWYWCARGVDERGLGGRYCEPIPFYVETDLPPDSAAEVLACENLSGWRNVTLEDGGWGGTVWAFADRDTKQDGRSAARVVFTLTVSISGRVKRTGATARSSGDTRGRLSNAPARGESTLT